MSEPRQDVQQLIQDLTCENIIECEKARRALVAMGAGR